MGFTQDICFLLSAGTVFTIVYFKVESIARLWLWVIFDWKNSFLMVNTCFKTWFQDGKCSYWYQSTVIKRPLQTVILISELFLISYNLKLYIFFYLLALDIPFIFGTDELLNLYVRDLREIFHNYPVC